MPLSMQNDLLQLTELPIKKCMIVRYSHGGHLFAAVGRSNTVFIYPSYSGSNTSNSNSTTGRSALTLTASTASIGGAAAAAAAANGWAPAVQLKAHVSTVTDIAFSDDDRKIVTCGAGGAVYFWDVASGSRLMELEYVDKKSVYYSGTYYRWEVVPKVW